MAKLPPLPFAFANVYKIKLLSGQKLNMLMYLSCWNTGGQSFWSPTWTLTVALVSTPAMLNARTTRE